MIKKLISIRDEQAQWIKEFAKINEISEMTVIRAAIHKFIQNELESEKQEINKEE